MATTWVAGTATARVTGTTLSSSLPTEVQTGDCVLAFVFARSALTAPAGWTFVRSTACVGGTVTQTVYCYKKDSVTDGDAGGSHSWIQAVSNRMGVTYALLRSNLGYALRVVGSGGSFVSNSNTGSLNMSSVAATRDQEIHLVVGSVINQSATISYTPQASNMTLWSGVALDNRLSGFRQELVNGESVFGSVFLSSSSANNGLSSVTIAISEATLEFEQADIFSSTDAVSSGGSTFSGLLGDAVRAAASALWGQQHFADWSDGAQHVDVSSASIPAIQQLADSLRVLDLGGAVKPTLIGDMFGIAESLPTKYFRSAASADGLNISGYSQVSQKLYNVLQSAVGLADLILRGVPVTTTESLRVSRSLSVARAISTIESLHLLETIAASAQFRLTQVERVAMADALRRFFGDGLVDAVGIASPITPTKRAIPSLTDALGVQHVSTPRFIFKVSESDAVDMNDLEFIRQLLKLRITDGVEITAAYIAPNDIFTTWNINAVSGSVSQYDNYAFNSFAKFGQMFIGADETGLYELSGADDDGDAIVARVKSGLAQLTASRFTMIRDAYIGMRGDGCFILRVTTGEGDVYDYAFDAQNMRTTRVPLGKGMRTRYVSFELIGDGADFDLESVEFIPLASTRRV